MANWYTSSAATQYAAISGVTTQTAIVAAAGAGMRIVVLSYVLTLDTAGEYLWESASNALTGNIEVAADTPCGMSSMHGVFETNANEALNLTCTTAGNGHIAYVVVPA